jgi:hypothetical protein
MNILLFLKKNCFRGMARTKQTARNRKAKKTLKELTKRRHYEPNSTAVASKVCACNNDPTAAMCKYCKGNCCLKCGNDRKPTFSDWVCWRCIDHEENVRRAERDVFTNARLLGYSVEQDGNDVILRIPGGMNDSYKAQLVDKITK